MRRTTKLIAALFNRQNARSLKKKLNPMCIKYTRNNQDAYQISRLRKFCESVMTNAYNNDVVYENDSNDKLPSYFSCGYDYLALYDGPNVNSSLLGKYCGSTFNPVSSSGRFLTLQFITNTYQQEKGFELRFNWTHTTISKQYICT